MLSYCHLSHRRCTHGPATQLRRPISNHVSTFNVLCLVGIGSRSQSLFPTQGSFQSRIPSKRIGLDQQSLASSSASDTTRSPLLQYHRHINTITIALEWTNRQETLTWPHGTSRVKGHESRIKYHKHEPILPILSKTYAIQFETAVPLDHCAHLEEHAKANENRTSRAQALMWCQDYLIWSNRRTCLPPSTETWPHLVTYSNLGRTRLLCYSALLAMEHHA